jgi:hypothetical protein
METPFFMIELPVLVFAGHRFEGNVSEDLFDGFD